MDDSIGGTLSGAETRSFDAIPAGEYTLRIAKVEAKEIKSTLGVRISVEFDVLGPTHKGRKVFGGFMYSHKETGTNPKMKQAVEIGQGQLKGMAAKAGFVDTVNETLSDDDRKLLAAGVIQPLTTLRNWGMLVGKRLLGKVIVEEYNGNKKNDVSQFAYAGEAAAGEATDYAAPATDITEDPPF